MEPSVFKAEWNEGMNIGIPCVDDEHQQFIQLVNDLNQAIASHAGLAEIKQNIQLIIDSTEQHFALEEMLLKQWDYPDADKHINKHAQARLAWQEIMAMLTKDSLKPQWIAAGLEVKNIMVNHLTEDMLYRDYYHCDNKQTTL